MENVDICEACGNASPSLLYTSHDRVFGLPGEFPILKCPECGLHWVSPRPDEEEIGAYYPAAYDAYQFSTSPTPGSQAPPRKPLARRMAKVMLGWALLPLLEWFYGRKTYQLPRLPAGKALEFGFGEGKVLARLKEAGWDAHGVERSAECVANARDNLGVSAIGIEQWDDSAEAEFDLVCAFHVLEHHHHPLDLLTKFRSVMKDDGTLVVEVPNARSFDYRVFRSGAVLHTPNHLYHYNEKNLRLLFKKAGFRVTRVTYPRVTNPFMIPLGFWLQGKWGMGRLSRLLANYHNSGSRSGRAIETAGRPLAILLSYLRVGGYVAVWATPDVDA
jgi:SAM-dependent methyltransferase